MDNFKQYKQIRIAEMMEWYLGYPMGNVSISPADKENGSPVMGDMISRNPKNHNDQWLVSAKYFKDNNFEVIKNA